MKAAPRGGLFHWNPKATPDIASLRNVGGNDMLRGGLLWLIGIPLPIILVLWLMGYLS